MLKFIGDAVLAIFPLQDDPLAAQHALEAAREALARIERFNEAQGEGEPELGVALALHLGEVNYGNIGIEGRLDFTVTGPAVNTVARLERLSKSLSKPIVASGDFAQMVRDEVVCLGTHDLRGLQAPVEVFTPNELA